MRTEIDAPVHEIYLAGERVPPGQYQDTSSGREICLERQDFLPASLDGRVAAYIRVEHTWRQYCIDPVYQHEAVVREVVKKRA